MQIIRIVKLTFIPEKVNSFLAIFEKSKDLIQNFEGCTHLELLNDVNEKNVFFTYSHWDSEEHLNKYRQSELFKNVWGEASKLFSAKPNAWSVKKL